MSVSKLKTVPSQFTGIGKAHGLKSKKPPVQPVTRTVDPSLIRHPRTTSRDYQLYMKSPEWRNTRRLAIEAAHCRCSQCGSPDALHVYHKHYRTVGHEALTDLAVICETCRPLT